MYCQLCTLLYSHFFPCFISFKKGISKSDCSRGATGWTPGICLGTGASQPTQPTSHPSPPPLLLPPPPPPTPPTWGRTAERAAAGLMVALPVVSSVRSQWTRRDITMEVKFSSYIVRLEHGSGTFRKL